MKIFFPGLLLGALVANTLSATAGAGPTPPADTPPAALRAPAPASADDDWEEVLIALDLSERNPDRSFQALHPRPEDPSPQVQFVWAYTFLKNAQHATMTFFTRHPTDSRRWTALMRAQNFYRSWAGQLGGGGGLDTQGAEVRAAVDAVWPEAERQAWEAELARLEPEALAAPDIGADDRFYFSCYKLVAHFGDTPPGSPRWAALGEALLELSATQPAATGGWAPVIVGEFHHRRFPLGTDATSGLPLLEALARAPNQVMAADARNQIRFTVARQQPIAFTAVDGRAVDLGRLKGKVVLVDYWATWCGPCKEELPNVKRVYAAYRDKGFEVVGIAMEEARLKPDDPPEQAGAKLEKAKKILTSFIAREQLPWPQYMDGRGFKTEFAARYGITAIPAMFLFDQQGRIVSTDARGPKLEAEVKRLLGL